jgi:hypothetical protein
MVIPMDEHISFEQYLEQYRFSGILLSGKLRKRPSKPLNDNQLRTEYDRHIRKIKRIKNGRIETIGDISKDQIVRMECQKRDRNRCRLMRILTAVEVRELFQNTAPILVNKLDAAHIFGKNAYPRMRYIIDNVVLLNRASHNWLDVSKSPLNGKSISPEQKQAWWERIVGKKLYDRLFEMSREN